MPNYCHLDLAVTMICDSNHCRKMPADRIILMGKLSARRLTWHNKGFILMDGYQAEAEFVMKPMAILSIGYLFGG